MSVSFEAILALLVFVFPGAAFLAAWDFQVRARDRSVVGTLGWGGFVSLVLYAVPLWLHIIDLTSLFPNDKLSASHVLTSANLAFFTVLVVFGGVVGSVAGRMGASHDRSNFWRRWAGRALLDMNWVEVARAYLGRYVHVRTASGEWVGILELIPQHLESELAEVCVLELSNVWWRKDSDSNWVALADERVMLNVKTIDAMSLVAKERADG